MMPANRAVIGVSLLLVGAASPALAAPGVATGVLSCEVPSGWGFVLGSYKDLACIYQSKSGALDHYAGKIGKIGVDLGYHSATSIGWTVIAPTWNLEPGALSGVYVGGAGSVTVGIGFGANALIGGGHSIALQPLSLQSETGLNVAGGVEMLTLQPVAPAAASLPPPPLPSAIPAAAPPEHDFTIYFDTNSSTLSPEARAIVRQSAAVAKQASMTRIAVTGHTDTVGTSQYNQRLSERRAAAVRAALVSQGIPTDQIDATGAGESQLAIPTAQGVNEPRNRRVVIIERGPGA